VNVLSVNIRGRAGLWAHHMCANRDNDVFIGGRMACIVLQGRRQDVYKMSTRAAPAARGDTDTSERRDEKRLAPGRMTPPG
jgi:hypothetical protein